MFKIKRIYESVSDDDGVRILVDRIWPRGLSKESAALDQWRKDAAPSTELRKWFGHEVTRWDEFRKRYRAELRLPQQAHAIEAIENAQRKHGVVTLLFSARDERHNQAVVLREYLESDIG